MAVLTVNIPLDEDVWRNVGEEAKNEATTREELVDKAVRIYIRTKALENLRNFGRELSAAGITEEDAQKALMEVKEDRRRRSA